MALETVLIPFEVDRELLTIFPPHEEAIVSDTSHPFTAYDVHVCLPDIFGFLPDRLQHLYSRADYVDVKMDPTGFGRIKLRYVN